ncbi:MAG TPA: hypothetical protein VJX91_00645 [Candidatus Eisenbacteria bacterium]|nr:hypothetical protein [Candidatus Eisenbacteria bacterium]
MRSRPFAAALLAALTMTSSFAAAQDSVEDKLHFSGYGEAHYNSHALSEEGIIENDPPAEVDIHRFVLGWRYDFTPKMRMDAEVDFEHSATEIELEYAYLEYDLAAATSLRAGSVLMPVGPLNEFHEPPNYYSVERPYVEASIMPTTWQEIGLGLVGRLGGGALGYRAYVVSGLNASGFDTFQGIREGRGHGAEAAAEDLAGVARLEYATKNGLNLGGSVYYGGADQGDSTLGDISVTIVNADARYRRAGLDLKGIAYHTNIGGADVVSDALGRTIGEEMLGWYGEAAYDVLRRDREGSSGRALFLFGRYESFDTNWDVSNGLTANPAANRAVITGGLSYMPVEKIAFKADLEHWTDDTDADLTRFNLGAAFQF